MSTEEKNFYNYVVIQFSGAYNMITEANHVMKLLRISKEEYFEILNKYLELKEKYKESYEEAKEKGLSIASKRNEEW